MTFQQASSFCAVGHRHTTSATSMHVNRTIKFDTLAQLDDHSSVQSFHLCTFQGARIWADFNNMGALGGDDRIALRLRIGSFENRDFAEASEDLFDKDGNLVVKKGGKGKIKKPLYKDTARDERIDVDFSFGKDVTGVLSVAPRQIVIDKFACCADDDKPLLDAKFSLNGGMITFTPQRRGARTRDVTYFLGSSTIQAELQPLSSLVLPFKCDDPGTLKPGVQYHVEAKLELEFNDTVSNFQRPGMSAAPSPARKRQRTGDFEQSSEPDFLDA
mmetsp:Transcript_58633/g.104274  ORF Transcript_58633/g.104274 Transcript_58633/m.104274 type:complete len:273 (-) Transcript_58633:63-881(-)